MSIVRTRPWSEVIAKLDESPYLPLVRFIAESEFSNQLHGDVFLSGLLLSDSPDFELGVHMLKVECIGKDHFRISYLRGRGGFKDETEKVCTGGEIIAAMDRFLKVKFGVALMVKKSDG